MDFTLPFDKFQEKVAQTFKAFTWEKPKVVNNCKDTSSKGIVLNNTQKFVSQYYNSAKNPNGILLWRSVGSGKTLSAVAILSAAEKQGYNTLWVTRTTLKGDLKKALDMVPLKKPLITLTYKQFSNIYKKSGENYRKLLTRARKIAPSTTDPLYKTVVIIDEAHKLFTKDLKVQEMHDIKAIEKMIFNSYESSKDNSAKIILMTGTPISENAYEAIQLFNLIIHSQKDRFNLQNFASHYLDEKGNFTASGKKEFKERIKGIVSFIDMSKDPSKFAQIDYQEILVPISAAANSPKDPSNQKKFCTDEYVVCREIKLDAKKCKDIKEKCKARVKEVEKDYKSTKYQKTLLEEKCNLSI